MLGRTSNAPSIYDAKRHMPAMRPIRHSVVTTKTLPSFKDVHRHFYLLESFAE